MNGLIRKSALALAVATAAFASNAWAVSFNFQASETNVASASYSQGGIDLTVTAFKNFGTTNDAAVISRAQGGLGVVGNPTGATLGANEALTFSFSPSVSLLSAVMFERGTEDESFRLFDANDVAVTDFTILAGATTQIFDFTSFNVVGNSFTIMGLETGNSDRGGRVAQIDVSAIPLPASLLLLLGGMGALAMVSMRRRERA